MHERKVATIFVLIGMLAGCTGTKPSPPVQLGNGGPRGVVVSGKLEVLPEQGWTDSDANWFYDVSQGSRLIPVQWFEHLELANSTESLIGAVSTTYGYIGRKNAKGEVQLPVGFAIDKGSDGNRWVGLNCAACHTNIVEHAGKSYLIDGAPALADFEGMMKAVVASMQATSSDPEKLRRFAKSLGLTDRTSDLESLKSLMQAEINKRAPYNNRNLPGENQPSFGFGRLDALGAILNEVTVRFIGIPDNHKSANAPVSYPFLWDTPHHDFVQWPGNVPNLRGGAFGRNVGQVVGVLGDIEVSSDSLLPGYASTINLQNVYQIEGHISKLQSPHWPFSPLDSESVERGKSLYIAYCDRCHHDVGHFEGHDFGFRRDDHDRRIIADNRNVGTDPLMVKNFLDRTAKTGPLEGKPTFPLSNEELGPNASGELLLKHMVGYVILGFYKGEPPSEFADLEGAANFTLKSSSDHKYKGRPLNGIWATAPFLHNGSVPTMRDLLKPASERPRRFWVGSRKYNPKNIGFETVESRPGTEFDVTVPGNLNIGHEYGTGVSEEDGGDGKSQLEPKQVEDLLEFIKSL